MLIFMAIVLLTVAGACSSGPASFEEYSETYSDMTREVEVERSNISGGNITSHDQESDNVIEATGTSSYATWTDRFDQHQKGVLDILLVIDNSGSMSARQHKLARDLPALLSYVSDSDWQVAVIGTKLKSCLSESVTKHTPNFEDRYTELVKLGATTNGEYYFYKAIHGLQGECDGTSSAWLRKGSTIAVLIVGDQHNECHGYDDGGETMGESLPADALCKSSDLISYLGEIRPSGNAKVYGIIPAAPQWGAYIGKDPTVMSIFQSYSSISEASYKNTLQEISQNVQTVLNNVFMLSHVPAGNVEVSIDGDAPLSDSQYAIDSEGKLLAFNKGYLPPENAEIEVSYSYLTE